MKGGITGHNKWLLVLLIVNILLTILHYVDNIIFFHEYPEPAWMTPGRTARFWFYMTPFAVIGYLLYRKGLRGYSYLLIYAYSLMSLLVLGHYLYAPIWEMSFKINLFILLEALGAVTLIAYTVWLQLSFSKSQQLNVLGVER